MFELWSAGKGWPWDTAAIPILGSLLPRGSAGSGDEEHKRRLVIDVGSSVHGAAERSPHSHAVTRRSGTSK